MSNLLCSGASTERAYIAFINGTQRNINIVWLNYKGEPVPFFRLEPGASRNCNTFVSHPWIFEDEITGEQMHVGNKSVYWPRQVIFDGTPVAVRSIAIIHFPLRSLKEISLWATAKYLSSTSDADALEIPVTLKEDLKLVRKDFRTETHVMGRSV